jgi:hypothetical protein
MDVNTFRLRGSKIYVPIAKSNIMYSNPLLLNIVYMLNLTKFRYEKSTYNLNFCICFDRM